MSAQEAIAAAEKEGIELIHAPGTSSGFKAVSVDTTTHKRYPYGVAFSRDGRLIHIGSFATAEEAALHLTVHSNRMLLAKGRHIHPGEVTDLSNYEGGLESVDECTPCRAGTQCPAGRARENACGPGSYARGASRRSLSASDLERSQLC